MFFIENKLGKYTGVLLYFLKINFLMDFPGSQNFFNFISFKRLFMDSYWISIMDSVDFTVSSTLFHFNDLTTCTILETREPFFSSPFVFRLEQPVKRVSTILYTYTSTHKYVQQTTEGVKRYLVHSARAPRKILQVFSRLFDWIWIGFSIWGELKLYFLILNDF